MKKKNIIAALLITLGLTGCYDLDKVPEGELSTSTTFFGTTSEITKYLNQFYETGVRTQPGGVGSAQGIAFGDNNSDNMILNSVDTRLAGESSLSDAVKLTNYTYIRNLNFLINNWNNCKDAGSALNQCKGEAYYFRAWYYYQMFVNYGPLTWVNQVLDPSQEQMERPRDSRTLIADSILADLDRAALLLNAQANSASMRVHKDVARALKSEVALFEATWEKYHKAKEDKFYDTAVTDAKINDYLKQAAAAAKEVMDRKVWSIPTGNRQTSYRDLFITLDLSSNPEVLWWKKYNAADNIGHSVTRYINAGGGLTGISASLVDDYLTIDGRPFTGSEKTEAKKTYGTELSATLRDPRLAQTVCTPGQMMKPDGTTFTLPPLNGNSYQQNTTGYSMLKYMEFNTTYSPTVDGEGKSQAPAIQFRYADILLNYAEALAEMDGAANAATIIEALSPLRQRAGMPDVDFDREYNTAADYPFKNLDKYIQAVRRERRIEKACEGRRLADILRWAAADELIVGKTPTGALFTGSNLETAYGSNLIYDQASGNNLFLTGTAGSALRYIIPFNTKNYPNGWQFDTDRDYLLPIQQRMISLTGQQWTQNPGW
ncbi:RagB/SusD family nutrient uptake outer membrane protein [Bacteroides helcogenes]|uniref:RagB/SusD domain protein n=1 Tax=Bacteroides helcogenes (strain ATCC 35417 / DSM 20613 / JCM 6297 / CCUG 15421 / P 36-108) TaxID=693979 RepID=E6SVH2_BACT6|nr:RagB/SusD family nutrient uptake outer membrane protein [Bacteroides helcogenes]ADV42482.1 RagB/SusD domain protein [Bacteroides helcogenes P 36-108]MDY5237757.1 RagB/SusD family nutrient uptake outer membrane protein [Bacteroides helcogenes]